MTPTPAMKHQVMLVRDEGLRLKAYKDSVGLWTIGVGRNLSARGITGTKLLWYRTVGISRETAMAWLEEDFRRARKDCEEIFGAALFNRWSLHRQLGWCNLAFNLGKARLLAFHNTLQFAKRENWPAVEAHLRGSKWFGQVGSRAERVLSLIVREEWPYA
jgi:lysozyme